MNRRGLLCGFIVAPIAPIMSLLPKSTERVFRFTKLFKSPPTNWHPVKWKTWMTELPEGNSSVEIIKIEDGSITVGKWRPDEPNSKS